MDTREMLTNRLAEIRDAISNLEERKKELSPRAAAGEVAAVTEFRRLKSMQRVLEDDAEPLSLALHQI